MLVDWECRPLPLYTQYDFRDMRESDLDWVLKARNRLYVRNQSENNHILDTCTHVKWFHNSDNTLKLIFSEDVDPIGVVLYEKDTCYWSFYLTETKHLSKGKARLMLSYFLVLARELGIKKIRGRIKRNNKPSLGLHRDFGFVEDQNDNVGFVKVVKEI